MCYHPCCVLLWWSSSLSHQFSAPRSFKYNQTCSKFQFYCQNTIGLYGNATFYSFAVFFMLLTCWYDISYSTFLSLIFLSHKNSFFKNVLSDVWDLSCKKVRRFTRLNSERQCIEVYFTHWRIENWNKWITKEVLTWKVRYEKRHWFTD